MYGSGELDVSFVLCNKRTEVRVIRVYNVANNISVCKLILEIRRQFSLARRARFRLCK